MERLPRVLPFWMMLLGIVGFFILGVLYFDVRGRETRSQKKTDAGVEDVQPLPESSDTTSTPEVLGVTTEEQTPLALPAAVPTTDIPAIAVYDCWTFEDRDDRMIVDMHYLNFGNDQTIPLVGPETIHLSCEGRQTYAVRGSNIQNTFFATLANDPPTDDFFFQKTALYRIDPFSGKTMIVSTDIHPVGTPQALDHIGLSSDETFIYMLWNNLGIVPPQAPGKESPESVIVRVSLTNGETRSFSAPRVRDPIWMNPSHTSGIGIEWSCYKSQCDVYPAFLHRLNLETGKTIRVGEVSDWSRAVDPIFIDDERVVVAGEDTPAFVMNIFTRATTPIRQITSSLDRLAITTDRSHIVVTGPNQPFTVIPVSELPKP